MAITVEVVQDWSDNLDFLLKNDSTLVDLTGGTVVLHLEKRDGTALSTTGKVSIVDATGGKVRYTPSTGDLLSTDSPMRGRFQVTLAGKSAYFPNSEADCWIVRKV